MSLYVLLSSFCHTAHSFAQTLTIYKKKSLIALAHSGLVGILKFLFMCKFCFVFHFVSMIEFKEWVHFF